MGYRFRRISTHVYFLIMFALAFLMINAIGGVFDSVSIAVSGSGSALLANSPFVTAAIIISLSTIGVMITASFMGQAVYRDFSSGIDPLLFTTPLSKSAYLGGRFAGALLMNLYIFLAIGFGMILASFMPWLNPDYFGQFHLWYYVQPYFTFVIPNLLFTGTVFFSLAALTRKMLPNYVGGVVLLVGNLMSSILISDLESKTLAAMLDPFGGQASTYITQYWSLAEQNAQVIPLVGLLLWNRVVWVGIGLVVFGVAYYRFSFSHKSAGGKRKPELSPSMRMLPGLTGIGNLPDARIEHSWLLHLKQYRMMTRREFWGIVKDVYFYAIVGAGILFLIMTSTQVGKLYGTTTFPVTYSVLDVLGGTFTLFMLIIITFYAGELVWKERELKIQQIHDALPIPDWVPLMSKFSALGLVSGLLLVVIMVVGMLTQVFKGYFNLEPGLYVAELFGVQLIDYLLLCVLAITVQVFVNHKYMGHMIMVIYYLFSIFMDGLGLEHKLYDYASDTGATYSDMNKYGHFLFPFSWFKLYWAAFALILAGFSSLFWVRGQEQQLRFRINLARFRLTRPILVQFGIGVLLFFVLGGFIFYNTNVLNQYESTYKQQAAQALFEKKYKRFENIPQPRITDVSVEVDIFPSTQDVAIQGDYVLRNKTRRHLDSLHLTLNPEIIINSLSLNAAYQQVLDDQEMGYFIFLLKEPLAPGDSLQFSFELAYENDGFSNSGPITEVVYNGTFFNNSIMPRIGYSADSELAADDVRKKHGLEIKERMLAVDDSVGLMNTYISHDSDWINFEAIVSTEPAQIALAPGYLQKEWEEEGRRYFHYKMDAPMRHFYSFLSAEYAVARDQWQDVAIEVYYHPEHDYNIDRMIASVKKSLDYYSTHFSPYQYKQLRILEFPRYASFAQAFPNTIPFSESLGFIARIEDEEDIDYPFYVTAHEVAHQWWAHQVIGGNVQGSTVMSETLSQYSALMVMEKEYGSNQMRRFLAYELDQYLQGRSFERKKEKPLILNENQGYIHYRKGSLIMYALKDYIGEDSLNTALSRYIDHVAFQEPPYTNSLELLRFIQEVTPDSLQYVLTDFFETITLYENRVEDASYTVTADSQYVVTLDVEAQKVRADSAGAETEIAFNDWIDIGVFAASEVEGITKEVPLYLEKHRISEGASQIQVTVDRVPERAGIDPYNKLIDRNKDDNMKRVTASEEGG